MKKSSGTISLLVLGTILLSSCGTQFEVPNAPVMPSLNSATVISIDETTSLYNRAKEAYLSIDTFFRMKAPQNIKLEYNEYSYQGTESDNNYLDVYGMIETNYSEHYLRKNWIYKGGDVSGGKETFIATSDFSELLYEDNGEITYKSYSKHDDEKPETGTDNFRYEDDEDSFSRYYFSIYENLNTVFIQANAIFNENFTLEDKTTDEYEDTKKFYSRGEGSFIVVQTYTYSYNPNAVHTYTYEYENNFIKYYSYNRVSDAGYSKANHAFSYNVTTNSEWNR